MADAFLHDPQVDTALEGECRPSVSQTMEGETLQAVFACSAAAWPAEGPEASPLPTAAAARRMDRPDGQDTGTLSPLVRLLTDDEDGSIALAAKQVRGWLHGQWPTDPRTTSSVYATAHNAVWPWTDPGLAASADGCEITLEWLCSGLTTLYLCAPLGDESRVGVVFAALLDLIAQAFERYNRQGAPVDPRLLVVLDEAANTPLPKLPQWAATITGAGIQLVHGVAVEGPARPGLREGCRQRPDEPPHEAHLPERPQRPVDNRVHQRSRWRRARSQ